MTKQLVLLSTLSAALLASFGAHAAESAELKVKGVVRPGACAPTFTGGGVVDYGAIATNALSATTPTALSEKAIAFTVTCDAAAKVAIRAIDNRKSSIVPGLTKYAPVNATGGFGDSIGFGLGTVANKNIGIYTLRIDGASVTADGTTPDSIYNTDAGGWAKTTNGLFYNDGGLRKAFSAPGTTYPAAYKTMGGNLNVQVVLDKGSNLPLSQEIQLDGSATIEVQYL